MFKLKGYDNLFKVGLIKKDLIQISQDFPKPHNLLEETLVLKLTLLIMQQKQILKMQQELIHLNQQQNLKKIKSEVDKLDIGKILPVPFDLSELSDVIKNDVVRKLCMINQLLKQIILILGDLC